MYLLYLMSRYIHLLICQHRIISKFGELGEFITNLADKLGIHQDQEPSSEYFNLFLRRGINEESGKREINGEKTYYLIP